ncbi:cell wall-binding repeat-containing protein [Herbiconiux sp. KACC 21604]|uniref:cell wall-binding repeat-containing protein n=1 Tax=unclassified Herbiconiux TaxID=2618217 RepID=UPI001492356A|nr:cell wall-binding repeat-containing protein [Herbiconiux sp. SALV-R1]QJU54451.1 hypothetical protein HL652_12985 [Herbiconiux sp. SALV-R1]WPO85529.1 cell wall-binding repeat-containing protein [Herbiconiux sp. KACC 21604]
MRVARFAGIGVIAVAMMVGPVLAGAPAEAAPSSVSFEVVSGVVPKTNDFFGLGVDSDTRRAYMYDRGAGTVMRYDFSSGSMSELAPVTIATIPRLNTGLLVNSTTHQVLMLDSASGSDEVVALDDGPASPTQGSLVARVATGRSYGLLKAIDESTNRALVSYQYPAAIALVDLGDGSSRLMSPGFAAGAVAVDNERGDFYISDPSTSSLIRLASDGSFTTLRLDRPAVHLAVSGEQLLVVTSAPFGMRVESRELVTLEKITQSLPLAGTITDVGVDEERHVIYLAHDITPADGISVLRTDDLSLVGTASSDLYVELEVVDATHQLIAVHWGGGVPPELQLLEPHTTPGPAVTRVGGADRYAVAAATSRSSFPPGVPVAYVASGEGFADALAGAAAAGQGKGPVLLVAKGSLPDTTRAELLRLRARKVVILGGEATVSAAVENALKAPGRSVERIAAADRYATSVAVSQSVFPQGASVVYLASGEVFPDALSASPLSGREAGPVLLTPKGALPPAVAAELTRLAPARVVVLGGSNAVGADVADAAAAAANAPVVRIDGSDRYAVSAAASAGSFRKHTFTVYIASGEVFPDALAAGPSAIDSRAPVLLVRRDEIPSAVAAELRRLAPYDIVVLGGPNTVSDAVLEELNDYLPE